MTCDCSDDKLECLTHNNNVTTNEDVQKLNGHGEMNGKAEPPLELQEEIASRNSLIILLSIFITSLGAMIYIYKNFPELEP